MTKDILEARIQELLKDLNESSETFQRLKTQIDNVTNNHNSLVGRLEETKDMHKKLCDAENISSSKTVVNE